MIRPPKDGLLWYITFPVVLILLFISETFETMSIKVRFALMSLLAMISVVSFFHIDSYIADKHDINYLFWLGGFTFAALAIWNLAIIMKSAGTGPEN